jgi:AcrR family transcriptional regulator
LAVARDVFIEEGYAATSMSAIAARVGGSKGTLYHYFRSKSELFGAVIRDDCQQSQTALFDLGSSQHDVCEALKTLGRRFLRLMLSDKVIAIHRIVLAESVRFPEIGEAHYDAGPRQGKILLMGLFAKAVRDGQLNISNPDRAADQLLDLMLSGLYRRRLWNVEPRPTEAEMDANVDAAIALFMNTYRAR